MMIRFITIAYLAHALCEVSCFIAEEYKGRVERVQEKMQEEGFDALLLTLPPHHIYFTGVNTEFFGSPTRPYFLVIPTKGEVTAIVPTVAAPVYEEAHLGRIITWSSPQPDDEGVSLLVQALKDLLPANAGRLLKIGAEMGPEMSLRMPANDFLRTAKLLESDAKIEDASLILKQVRSIKSNAEIALQKKLCRAQSRALDNIPNIIRAGMTEKEVGRLARIELLKAGADRVGYVSLRSGPGGYTDIVGAAGTRRLQEGDVLIIDTGSVMDNYYCDFNRNWYVGWEVPKEIKAVQEAVYRALDAGIQAAKPGSNTADVFHAMANELPGDPGNVGRWGHSEGLVITEWPSIMPAAANRNVTIEENMVFSLEPGTGFGDGGKLLVHEDVIVIRKGGAELISKRGPREMPLITLGLPERKPIHEDVVIAPALDNIAIANTTDVSDPRVAAMPIVSLARGDDATEVSGTNESEPLFIGEGHCKPGITPCSAKLLVHQ